MHVNSIARHVKNRRTTLSRQVGKGLRPGGLTYARRDHANISSAGAHGARAARGGYDTSKLADEWEVFLPERIVKRGGKDIRIVQEFNAKKKNGLAVYEVSLYVSPYLSHSGMRDRWRCSHCSVLEIVCKGDVSAALSSPLC